MSDPAPDASAPPPVSTDASAPPAPAPLKWVLVTALALGPVVFAVLQLGRWHPDEVYQFLEPAFFRVHDYGIRAWEWKVGLRNWAIPFVFAACLELAARLGIDHPHGYRALIAVPQLMLNLGMAVAVWRYVERRLLHEGSAWVALAFVLFAGYAPVLLFSGRTMGESLSAAFLVLAVERLDSSEASARRGAMGGLWLGLSVVVRYGSAVFVVAALLWLVATRRWRTLLWTCAAGGVVAAGLGALDWVTWGKPFHSLLTYTDFNVLSGKAAQQFGASPPWYYLPVWGMWAAAWAWPGIVVAVLRERRVPLAALMAFAYLAVISGTPHKEDRFIYPALVLFALAAAPGVVWLLASVRAVGWRAAAIALTLAIGWVPFVFAPDFRGDQFRAQVKATRDPSVTGLLIVGDGLWGSGGHFYIGRNIPFYNGDLVHQIRSVLRGDRRVNRVISFNGLNLETIRAEGFEVVDKVGREYILARKETGG